MTEQRPKRVLWLSPMCSLDRRSGAACQVRSVLSALVEAGWAAYTVEMTLFDAKDPYPVHTIIGKQWAKPDYHGKTFKLHRDGILHHLFYTKSTFGRDLEQQEAQAFFERARRALDEIRPDVVVTYGGSNLCKALIKEARKRATAMVFFLANASYDDASLFAPFDEVVVNSQFTRGYYRDKLGIASSVQPEILPPDVLVDPEAVLAARAPAQRHFGMITMVNPAVPKGATLFARLVLMAARRRPEWTFLAVEGRMTDEQWRDAGLDLANQPNVFWIPNQQDMRRVYARTSVLLLPTFQIETAGRVAVEAQLGGIPVLGASHGGIPEMLGEGGFTFDIPEACQEQFARVPTEDEAEPWFQTLERLMDDEAAYREASQRARSAALPRHPEQAKQEVVALYERILADAERRYYRQAPTVGRNDPCPCGSGKKAKHCCGVEAAVGS
ncbi:MAG: glycosyltransferase [Halorhodospira sp.]